MTQDRLRLFRETVLAHYREHGRDLPWRATSDPYAILVSEVMLQQTQVARVVPKYREFLTAFPDVTTLSKASVASVLSVWMGLGYNRRALALHQTAQIVVERHAGILPDSPLALRRLPGIGAATAAAVCVFAHDAPLVFIETNIRAAFIHFFFEGHDSVPDSAILPLVELTLDREQPRHWYYALMDYGVWVKRQFANPSRRSSHHAAQSPFLGSHRQLRASVLRAVLSVAPAPVPPAAVLAMIGAVESDAERVTGTLDELAGEGFLAKTEDGYRVA